MRHADKMIAAIYAELQLRKMEAQRPVETIYFGGGTPSVLSKEHIVGMLDQVHQHYDVIQSPEITLEANPDDLNLEYMQALQEAGLN